MAAATASALPGPETSSHTRGNAGIAGRVKVIRRGGGFGESSTATTMRVLEDGGAVREQRVNVALGPHAQQVDVEIRRRVTWCGTGGQHLFVGQGRGVQIAAEVTITGGHRVHLVRWNVDVIEQRPPGLLEIALVIVFGNVAFVAPEQVHLGPFNLLCLGAEVAQKRNPVAAPVSTISACPLAATAAPMAPTKRLPAAATRMSLSGKISMLLLTGTAPS